MLKRHWRGFHRLPRLHSLRTKFALGYTLVALFAITAIFLAAIITVIISFGRFQSNQLSDTASTTASQLGQQYTNAGGDLKQAIFQTYPYERSRPNDMLWLMDSAHQIILRPPADGADTSSQDARAIQDAMIRAMQGREIQETLPGQDSFLWFDLSGRSFVADPIHAGGTASGQIVGALTLVELRPKPGTPPYTSTVLHVLLFTVLGTALVVALLGMLLSRGVTRPLEQLTRAATQMAAGEYSQRVSVKTKDEVGRLAAAFNEMASALERDVGELHRQEALRRELSANISHDLATPLTAIQGFTEALIDGVIQDESQREETLRLMDKEVTRLRRLVGDLSNLSRVESAGAHLDLAPVQLASLVDETLAVLQPELEAKDVSAHNLLTTEIPMVLADSDKLTQVLLNLLDNALRYTPAGGSITISARLDERQVRVQVQDTGSGIAPAHLKRIFDRFYRADASRNTATGGSGLGLAIVKAIIEAHGGAIGVESAASKGAAIWFTLPKME